MSLLHNKVIDVSGSASGIGCAAAELFARDIWSVRRRLMAQQSGSIVNTSSIAGMVGLCGCASYVAANNAIVRLSRTAALESAEDKIRVSAICPGLTATTINTTAYAIDGRFTAT